MAGGLIVEPRVRGSWFDVHEFDVTSMYPSVIAEFGLTPEAIIEKPVLAIRLPDKTKAAFPTGLGCNKDTGGFLVDFFGDSIRERASDGIDTVRRKCLKFIMNASTGCFAAPTCKAYFPEVYACMTAKAQTVLRQIESRVASVPGARVVYGDTDSIFVTGARLDALNAKIEAVQCTFKFIKIHHANIFRRYMMPRAKMYIAVDSLGAVRSSGVDTIETPPIVIEYIESTVLNRKTPRSSDMYGRWLYRKSDEEQYILEYEMAPLDSLVRRHPIWPSINGRKRKTR